jgi:acetoin utilization deacetylase AcuC-like enzyme
MRAYYTREHHHHAPRAWLFKGDFAAPQEVPERAEVLERAAREGGHEMLQAAPAHPDALRPVHDDGYLRFLEHAWRRWRELPEPTDEVIPNVHPGRRMHGRPHGVVGQAGWYQADGACPIGEGTWRGALASAGVALAGADAILSGGRHAYALCRPPGHHAYQDLAGGFCFLNNTAIAVERCRAGGAAKVAVVDVDVHHGNGTQGIFYQRADVLTVSLHGDPASFYPWFAGYADETGAGAGLGANLNLPLARGTGDDAYLGRLEGALEAVAAFAPEVVIVALGLDASEHDPLAFLAVTTAGFRRIGERLGQIAPPTLLVQEGGYLSEHLGANLQSILDGFECAHG